MRFDPNEVKDDKPPAKKFEVLPEGIYKVNVNNFELKQNRNSEGSHVSVEFQVIEGAGKDRRVWHNFNVENSKEMTRKIGRAELKRFLAAIGIHNAIDLVTEAPFAVRGKTLYVDIVHEPDFRDPTKMKERIKKFDAAREASTASKAQGQSWKKDDHAVQAANDKLEEIPF